MPYAGVLCIGLGVVRRCDLYFFLVTSLSGTMWSDKEGSGPSGTAPCR
jgi:hypothetical protein